MQSRSDAVPTTAVTLDIVSSSGSYPVLVASGALDAVLAGTAEDHIHIVDAALAGRLEEGGFDPIVIEATEAAKSLDRMTDLIVALRERKATRRTTLIAIGGGVVQDAAAFAASVYMRGIDWIYVPTTLLSMTDSCIGGKSSINVGRFKNIVGTFHPPTRIVVDPDLTETLSAEQKAGGLCEAAKIAICRGPDTLARYLALDPRPAAGSDQLTTVIVQSLTAKKWFIEIDEFDRAERLLLNFGHTFGHAIEAATDFGIGHGIAVGLGMLAAFHLGEALGRDYAGTPDLAHFRTHVATLVAAAPDVPAMVRDIDPARLIAAFEADKKHRRDAFTVILPTESGMIEPLALMRDATTLRHIGDAFAAMIAEHADR